MRNRRYARIVVGAFLSLCAATFAAPASAAPLSIALEMWKAGPDEAQRAKLFDIEDGMKIRAEDIPAEGMNVFMRADGDYTHVYIHGNRPDGVIKDEGWGPTEIKGGGAHLFGLKGIRGGGALNNLVGKYRVTGRLYVGERVAKEKVVTFEILAPVPPRNTRYTQGRKDIRGNPITTSAPVILGGLNETPKLKDFDYAFEPQQAYNAINFERFPPFRMAKHFRITWDTLRQTDEAMFGGPLNRGFTMVTRVKIDEEKQRMAEVIAPTQRASFNYPGLLKGLCKGMYEKDPVKYLDLKGWADHYNTWISSNNAYELGWELYNSYIGTGGLSIWAYDEEEMWPACGEYVFKNNPEYLPEDLKRLREEDPEIAKPETKAAIEKSYLKNMAEFYGHLYRGIKAHAAATGRPDLKTYHYGLYGIGLYVPIYALTYQADADIFKQTGNYTFEEPGLLHDWFKDEKWRLDWSGNTFLKQIDYLNKDSYFFTVCPETNSFYERDGDGAYVLDDKGRRKFRTGIFEEKIYADTVKYGYEDCEFTICSLKEFVAKGENSLFWMNGGKYYGKTGTLVTQIRHWPTIRPDNQATYGKATELGTRPDSPYMAEARVIHNFMIGLEGYHLWDEPEGPLPIGGDPATPDRVWSYGEIEYFIKGMHRLSQFNALFERAHVFIRPVRMHNLWDRDHPIIRGIISGRDMLITMTNPYLDLGEAQEVEIWYDKPYEQMGKAVWKDKVRILPRKNHLFQCRLPVGSKFDPDKLYFRYTCVDGNYTKTYIVSGNYTAPYPHAR